MWLGLRWAWTWKMEVCLGLWFVKLHKWQSGTNLSLHESVRVCEVRGSSFPPFCWQQLHKPAEWKGRKISLGLATFPGLPLLAPYAGSPGFWSPNPIGSLPPFLNCDLVLPHNTWGLTPWVGSFPWHLSIDCIDQFSPASPHFHEMVCSFTFSFWPIKYRSSRQLVLPSK